MSEDSRFRDIDLNFIPHPVSGDLSVKTDHAAIRQSLKALLLLRKKDKPFHPEIASGIPDLLFEPATIVTTIRLEREIERVIRNYEPRINLSKILVDMNDERNEYEITIRYNIINEAQTTQVKLSLQRLR